MRISDWSSDVCSSDLDRVTLRLRLDVAGNLSGSWEYRVAPFLERDEPGRGRNGLVEESEDGVWLARGAETWSRPRTVLYGAVPVRAEERRAGKECVSTCRSGGLRYQKKQKKHK